jgi:hypothetical protein
MSTSFVDISYDLVDGIYDVLTTHVTVGGITYPVYKSMPKTPAATYVYICNVLQMEDGTKDSFLYNGTVQIHIVTEGRERADLKLTQDILGVVRSHLKTSKGATFSIGSRTLVVFSHESLSIMINTGDNGLSNIRFVDMYNFLID